MIEMVEGALYRRRDGYEPPEMALRREDTRHPWQVGEHTYTSDGHWSASGFASHLDLIEMTHDPRVQQSVAPSAPDDGGPAFPVCFEGGQNNGDSPFFAEGMSLRDSFALAALGSVMTLCIGDQKQDGETLEELFARRSYEVADAMLKARAQ